MYETFLQIEKELFFFKIGALTSAISSESPPPLLIYFWSGDWTPSIKEHIIKKSALISFFTESVHKTPRLIQALTVFYFFIS